MIIEAGEPAVVCIPHPAEWRAPGRQPARRKPAPDITNAFVQRRGVTIHGG